MLKYTEKISNQILRYAGTRVTLSRRSQGRVGRETERDREKCFFSRFGQKPLLLSISGSAIAFAGPWEFGGGVSAGEEQKEEEED